MVSNRIKSCNYRARLESIVTTLVLGKTTLERWFSHLICLLFMKYIWWKKLRISMTKENSTNGEKVRLLSRKSQEKTDTRFRNRKEWIVATAIMSFQQTYVSGALKLHFQLNDAFFVRADKIKKPSFLIALSGETSYRNPKSKQIKNRTVDFCIFGIGVFAYSNFVRLTVHGASFMSRNYWIENFWCECFIAENHWSWASVIRARKQASNKQNAIWFGAQKIAGVIEREDASRTTKRPTTQPSVTRASAVAARLRQDDFLSDDEHTANRFDFLFLFTQIAIVSELSNGNNFWKREKVKCQTF